MEDTLKAIKKETESLFTKYPPCNEKKPELHFVWEHKTEKKGDTLILRLNFNCGPSPLFFQLYKIIAVDGKIEDVLKLHVWANRWASCYHDFMPPKKFKSLEDFECITGLKTDKRQVVQTLQRGKWVEQLTGHVKINVKQKNKLYIECDTAYWDAEDSLLTIPGSFYMVDEKQKIEGKDARFEHSFRRYEINKVKAVYEIDEKEK